MQHTGKITTINSVVSHTDFAVTAHFSARLFGARAPVSAHFVRVYDSVVSECLLPEQPSRLSLLSFDRLEKEITVRGCTMMVHELRRILLYAP